MAKTIKGGASSSPGRTKAAAPAGSGLATSSFADVESDEMNAAYSAALDSLTKSESDMITKYTGNSIYGALNKMLREEGFNPAAYPGSAKTNQVNQLDAALAKGTLGKNIVLYRGFSSSQIETALGNGTLKVGSSITDPGYMSTSIKGSGAFGGNIKYKIYAPKGTKGLYIDKKSKYKSEYEFLLPRSTTVVVRSISKFGGQWQVEVEVLP